MNITGRLKRILSESFDSLNRRKQLLKLPANNAAVAALTVTLLYLSLVVTSAPIESRDEKTIERAVALLE